MPDDARVVGSMIDHIRQQVCLKVESPALSSVYPGHVLPEIGNVL